MEIKNEHIFGGALLDLLKEIDEFPREVSDKLQSIIMLHGEYAAYFDVKRCSELEILIENGFFDDLTDKKDILERHYSRDNLFKELSKRQYDIQPNTNTTKKEMINWILNNSETLTDRLAGKYLTLAYSEKINKNIKELKNFLNELDARYTYRADRIYLVDFYNELQEKRKEEERTIESLANDIINAGGQGSTKSKMTALLLCIFGGYFGLHHFYTGKVGIGILYLCTVGLFGVGWIIDIVRIARGNYTDKNGKYLK